ncbi:MAG TPA: flagellar basal body P-ring formation chaperone FlgA [Pyrinomonadaceae bacterium]|nr:flagellar basal body P-ring formation chaperone FlgA [Pyrinomonadaceae bacterium]
MKNLIDILFHSFFRSSIFTALSVGIFSVMVGVCLCPNVLAQGKLMVRIPAETTITADQIALGDIAEISGGGISAALASAARARQVSLGFSPRVGAMREIGRANILLALAAAGFNENDLALDIPEKVLVKRAAQSVSQNMLREAVEKAILPQLEAEKVSARITKLQLPDSLEIPTGNVEIRVVNFSGITNFLAPSVISLELRVDGKVLRRVPVNVEVEASADVLVLNRSITAGTKLTAADVHTEKVRLERSLSSYFRTPAEIGGKKLLKNVAEHAPLTTDAVAADTVIKTGDTVSIIVRSGNTQISVTGEARASGRIGDRIAVKNTQSGIILQARVEAEGLVKLSF